MEPAEGSRARRWASISLSLAWEVAWSWEWSKGKALAKRASRSMAAVHGHGVGWEGREGRMGGWLEMRDGKSRTKEQNK